MSIKKILSEITPHQKERLESLNHVVVDDKQLGKYNIVLIKLNEKGMADLGVDDELYQVAINTEDGDFTNMDQVMKRIAFVGDKVNITMLRDFMEILQEWVKRYGSILVLTNDDRKLNIYKRILKDKFNFRVVSVRISGAKGVAIS